MWSLSTINQKPSQDPTVRYKAAIWNLLAGTLTRTLFCRHAVKVSKWVLYYHSTLSYTSFSCNGASPPSEPNQADVQLSEEINKEKRHLDSTINTSLEYRPLNILIVVLLRLSRDDFKKRWRYKYFLIVILTTQKIWCNVYLKPF